MKDDATDTARMKAIFVLATAIAFAVAPFATEGFGGFDPDRFPIPQVEPPVQPAGYAFAIWGPIYLWLVAHAGFGLFARSDDAGWDATRWPLIVSLVVGAPWIAVARNSPILATAMIWVMLAAALWAFLRAAGRGDRWWLAAPLGLYAGWLTAAANVSLAVTAAGYGFGPEATGWAWAGLALAFVIALAVLFRATVPEYALAVAWALVAVAVQNWGGNTIFAVAALAGAAILLYRGFTPLMRRG